MTETPQTCSTTRMTIDTINNDNTNSDNNANFETRRRRTTAESTATAAATSPIMTTAATTILSQEDDDGRLSPPMDFSLDAIEEFLDFCDVVGTGTTEDVEEENNNNNPTTRSTDQFMLYNYAPSTGVPMEIQENAKLPTFNLTVDRSNSTTMTSTAARTAITAAAASTTITNGSELAPSTNTLSLLENNPYFSHKGQPSPTTRKHLQDHFNKTNNDDNDNNKSNSSDLSLTEVFLKSSDRSSINLNYSAVGGVTATAAPALVAAPPTATAPPTHRHQDTTMPTAPSPTPAQPKLNPDNPTTRTTIHQAAPAGGGTHLPHHQYSYLAHGRPYQLPIPAKSPPAKSPPTERRLKTKAYAATSPPMNTSPPPPSQQQQLQQKQQQPPPPLPKLASSPPMTPTAAAPVTTPPTAYSYAPPTSTSATSTTMYAAPPPLASGASAPPPPTYYHHHHHHPSVTHAAAHATSTASLAEATRRRSQFGFGANHVVPSVPLPPPSSSSKRTSTNNNNNNKSTAKKKTVTATTTTTTLSSLPPSANSGAAYERKKQRAKDARVKLNESIERLSIAIHLAGSQSQQRHRQGQTNSSTVRRKEGSDVEGALVNLELRTLEAMKECTNIAEAAKKWDRPSFVGTAATLIQALNTQCEALMRELVKAQKNHKKSLEAAAAAAAVAAAANNHPHNLETAISVVSTDTEATNSNHNNHHQHDLSGESPRKRQKRHETNEQTTAITNPKPIMRQAFGVDRVVRCMATFLDPRSLLIGRLVSCKMRNILEEDTLWMNLAMQRFGTNAVRRTKERMDDDDDDDEEDGNPLHTQNSSGRRGSSWKSRGLDLYRKMDVANTRPPMLIEQEGSVLLGEVRLPGKMSCWVTMVERSNGETYRSVQRPPTTTASSTTTPYTSLPVVELRFLIQNTGCGADAIGILHDQTIMVDASTRRRGEVWEEISWDDRFVNKRRVFGRSTTTLATTTTSSSSSSLALYQSMVLVVSIHAKGCPTTHKFRKRANYTKLLIQIHGTTLPLVIPFARNQDEGIATATPT